MFLSSNGIPVMGIKERGAWKSDYVFHYMKKPLVYRINKENLFAPDLVSLYIHM